MKRAVVILVLPFVLSACAYVNGEHHVVLKSERVLVDYDTTKVTAAEALQRATEQCSWKFGKKPVLQTATPGKGQQLAAEFYRCV